MNVFVLALTCVQWSAGLAMADECVRKGGVPYEFAASLSLPPENWLTLIRPGIFGDLEHAPYWGRWYIWEMCLFFGAIGLFFSGVGLFHARRRLVLSVGGIVLALGVLAMGAYSPHFRFFYEHVPGFNVFRSNSKFGVLAVVFLIFLSAHGLDLLCRGASEKLAAGMFFGSLAACGAVTLLIGAVEVCSTNAFQRIINASLNSGETFLINPQAAFGSTQAIEAAANFTAGELAVAWCFLAALSVVLGLVWRRPQLRTRLAPLLLGLIAFELLLFAWSMHASFSPELIRSRLGKAVLREPRADGGMANQPISNLDLFMQQNLGDGRTLSLDTLNLAPFMTGVDDMWGYGSDSVVRRHAEFLAFTQGDDPNAVTGYQRFTQVHPRFDMLRCKYVLALQPDGSMLVTPAPVPPPLPRFLLIRDWRVTPERDAVFEQISRADFDPRQTVLLERQPRGWSVSESKPAADAGGTIRILGESTDWQEIEVTLDKPAILLETDLYTPNWHVAALTGSSQTDYELIPANYVLRGVPLAAGTHRLRIEYRPAAFVVGKWVSLTALAAYLPQLAWSSGTCSSPQNATGRRGIIAAWIASPRTPGKAKSHTAVSGRRLGAFSLRKIASSRQPLRSPRCFWLISRHGTAASVFDDRVHLLDNPALLRPGGLTYIWARRAVSRTIGR